MNNRIIETNTIQAKACLSDCGSYRYCVSRVWDEEKNIGTFICLNPSKATSLMSDTTFSNCNNLAVQWEWGGFNIINLFAYMATDPRELRTTSNPIGVHNDEVIQEIASVSDYIILAWGNNHQARAQTILNNLEEFSDKMFFLRKNKGGGFLHPSRIRVEDYPQLLSLPSLSSLNSNIAL